MHESIESWVLSDLEKIIDKGWIVNSRAGNHGSVGNLLEDLLGVPENNLPIPDLDKWELKSKRVHSNSLVTLFHLEPFPRKYKFVPNILLPLYGWKHDQAGILYPETEMSFRQTINAVGRSDRGFKVEVDRSNEKVQISFDSSFVDSRHQVWLDSVISRVGASELSPKPYWDFDVLTDKVMTKLNNCLFLNAQSKVENGIEYTKYLSFEFFIGFNIENFLRGLEEGFVYVDFDARTGHNHGTKFRIRKSRIFDLYAEHITLT
ncbi:MvaI/BcnI family restriction endonuclease [Bacillus kwashiorkori]|uniref:MvaI/BcnI family restriction endonuclease n=1 Tax=Bacillus kwashiorkori TaxID=1522318 RepID=UPI000785079F|nr:MvaI/BcnI family restriction endonuclease [Bacillus kwashiorkori]